MEKRSLQEDAARRALTNVCFLDPVPKEEVLKYILAADIGASVLKKAKTFETVYSNKTFDYFSCKKPVLMAIEGVSKTLVSEADAGRYVAPENALDFAAQVRYYLDHPEKIKIHGENGYRYAREHFDRKKLALSYLRDIQGVVH